MSHLAVRRFGPFSVFQIRTAAPKAEVMGADPAEAVDRIGRMERAKTREEVVAGVAEITFWWLTTRRQKLVELQHESMAVNPFMAPLLMSLGGMFDFEELAEYLVGGHSLQGNATGFGKLVDEKILPRVFETTKLDRAFRRSTPPYERSKYDEIDHIVWHGDKKALLSVKAGRWTIQLTMAVQLNHAFAHIKSDIENGVLDADEIVVGVFYGSADGLTDKYRIIRGINTGATHDVEDLTDLVRVVTGNDFWTWLNFGEPSTQEWVMDGILQGRTQAEEAFPDLRDLGFRYRERFVETYAEFVNAQGEIDWQGILKKING